MKKTLAFLAAGQALPAILSACGYVSEYEEGVYDYESVYCYQSIGAIQCFDAPRFRDEKRLVNYYGPAPERYDRLNPPPEPDLAPPPGVNFFVRDPEPVPRPSPTAAGPQDLPWLNAGAPTAPTAPASVPAFIVIEDGPDAGDRE